MSAVKCSLTGQYTFQGLPCKMTWYRLGARFSQMPPDNNKSAGRHLGDDAKLLATPATEHFCCEETGPTSLWTAFWLHKAQSTAVALAEGSSAGQSELSSSVNELSIGAVVCSERATAPGTQRQEHYAAGSG